MSTQTKTLWLSRSSFSRLIKNRQSAPTWSDSCSLALAFIATTTPGLASLRVPAVYLTWANPLFLVFLPFNRISNLRGINEAQNSDSPRLHQLISLCLYMTATRGNPNRERGNGFLFLTSLLSNLLQALFQEFLIFLQ